MRFGLMEAVGETGSPDATNGMGWAWRAAWREACDSAWDAGVRWSPVDTERGIAGRIAECLEAVTPEGESDFGAYLAELADHVTAGASDVRRAVAGTVARVVRPVRRRRETTRQCGLADGAADVFLETERKDFRMFSLEERERAVELYFTTPMTTAQVVEHLGYPTRQCLERWLAMDSRYAGHMAKPIIPLETRRRAVELVLGGMQQKQAAKQLGVSVGAVHGWVRAYRKGGMAALQPKNRNSAQGNKPADSVAGRPQPMMMTRRLCAAGSRSWSWRTR